MVALATILSLIKLIPLPMEGSLTLLSMLPICVIAFRYGTLKGLGVAFVYSLFQFALGLPAILSWGLSVETLIGTAMLDYLIPFTALGLAGVFGSDKLSSMAAGVTLALTTRFLSHFLSGVIIFQFLEQWELFGKIMENRPYLYSLAYNGVYMLPELILTLIAVVILYRVPIMRKFISPIKK
jgi:thiamine transporter